MNLKAINLSTFRNILVQFIKNLSWLFFGAFLILLIFEVLEINKSFQVVLNVDQEPVITIKDKGERINFDNYDWVINKIQGAANFVPQGGITKNPFGTLAQ